MPPNTPDDTSSLERLRQKLYAPQAPENFPAPTLSQTPAPPLPAEEGWAPPASPQFKKKPRVSWAAIFLGVAAVFFILAVAGAAYFLVFGGRSVSTDRITILADGPTSISSGDEVTILVSLENRNPVTIMSTSLTAEFPDTTRSSDNEELPFTHYEDIVGDIVSGESGTRSIRARIFGSEGERVVVPIRFEYRIEGSNAVFVKEAEYEVQITSSPISIRAEAVSEAAVGQPLTFAVTVRSNAKEPIENVAVFAQYPFGFTARRGEGPVFPVGTLAPGEERTVTVTGTLTGENNDERVFRFTGGIRRGEETSVLAVSYSTALASVTLAKPFLSASLSLNRDTSNTPVIEAGSAVQSIVSWVNTLATPVLDGQVSVKLSGAALDTSSVSAYGGFYRSSDTTIIYSRETESGLGNLAPGATGSGTFSFRTKPAASLVSMKNPTIIATISVAGRRVGESNVPENISSSVTRTIKIGTDLALAAKSLYSTGAFKNTGPWPPVADQETTYTIDLSLTNTVNSVADTVVSGVLPSYVRYVGVSSPADGSVSYNAATRTVTWRAGEIPAGTGFAIAARTAAFQVALLPSASQRGTSPILMSSVKVTGTDRFTQKALSLTRSEITTQTLSDPSYVQGKGEVR
ncbi:MAG: hypothetical protein QG636_441 [Patescibacteria group bacterium]|nr:hypothetical protein [Patescibacteria group bacterium]